MREIEPSKQECEFCYDILPSHKSNCRLSAPVAQEPCNHKFPVACSNCGKLAEQIVEESIESLKRVAQEPKE